MNAIQHRTLLLQVLGQVEQRLREDEVLIKRQRELIKLMTSASRDTRQAERLLRALVCVQQLHVIDKKRVLAELGTAI